MLLPGCGGGGGGGVERRREGWGGMEETGQGRSGGKSIGGGAGWGQGGLDRWSRVESVSRKQVRPGPRSGWFFFPHSFNK